MSLRPIAAAATQRRYGAAPTAAGLGFFVATLVMGAVSLQPSANVLMVLLGMFVGILGISFFAGWWSLRRIEITRVLPDACVSGAADVVRYRLHNTRPWGGCFGLHLSETVVNEADGARIALDAFAPAVRASHWLTVSVPVVWPRRGRLRFESITVTSRFPFGLVAKRVTLPMPQELIVYPSLGTLRTSLWNIARGVQAASPTGGAGSRSGGNEEFFGLRHYRPGDNPRRIHWKRSARTGQLYVREMSRPRVQQVWCIIDTRIDAEDPREKMRLELALSCAATVVCDMLERGAKVGLVAGGQPTLASPPGTGPALRGRLLRELALRPLNTNDPLLVALTRIVWPTHWRGPCLLFSPTESSDLTKAADWLLHSVGPVTLLVPGTPLFDSWFSPRHASMVVWDDLRPVDSLSSFLPHRETAA